MKMRTVDYDHVLQILENYAREGKSARDVKIAIMFVFGD